MSVKKFLYHRVLPAIFCLIFSFLLVAPNVFAQSLSQDDQNSIYGDTVWYKPSAGGAVCLSTNSGTVSSGTISPGAGKGMTDTAQQKFQQILVAAGSKFNVSPNFIAAFYYSENSRTGDSTNNGDSAQPPPVTGDGNWREPAPPYGTGAPWPPPNAFTAQGPFQFTSSTWKSYGVDGNGDGKIDVNDLADASFGAAKLLAANGGTSDASQTALKKAAFNYNHSDIYAQSVLNTYNYLSGGGQSTVLGTTGCSISSAGFTNPFPGGWIPNRLDMGYDGTFKGQIVAPFSGTIIYAGLFNGWNGSYGVIIKSSVAIGSGVPTDTLYFTEGVYPLVKSGQTVSAGTPIAKAYPSPYGNAYLTSPDGLGQIEWGVAQDGPIGTQTDTYSIALGSGKCPAATPQSRSMVLNFSAWAQQTLGLSAPSTTSEAGCA